MQTICTLNQAKRVLGRRCLMLLRVVCDEWVVLHRNGAANSYDPCQTFSYKSSILATFKNQFRHNERASNQIRLCAG